MRNTEFPTGMMGTPATCPQGEARGHTGEHHERRKPVEIRDAGADRVAGNLGAAPFDRECDGRAAYDAEIVGVVGVLPDVLGVHDQVSSEGLLQADVKFVAVAAS